MSAVTRRDPGGAAAVTRYRTIVADPPWEIGAFPALNSAGSTGWKRDGDEGNAKPPPFVTMSEAQIAALPVADLAEDDAHLYLWTFNRHLESAFDVARAWRFRPAQVLTWCKPPMGGLGGAFVQSSEFVLFCRRGKLPHTRRGPSTWFQWPRTRHYTDDGRYTQHSAKPEAFLDLVEQVSPGPYLELFARRDRLGWDTWGNESLGTAELAA
jgi:N6-adenosine-specific RNA methylase IME4